MLFGRAKELGIVYLRGAKDLGNPGNPQYGIVKLFGVASMPRVHEYVTGIPKLFIAFVLTAIHS